MARQNFFVPGPLPGMNDYIGKDARRKYGREKKQWATVIRACIRKAKIKPAQHVWIVWQWREPNRRRDPDNFVSMGEKFILDALQEAGILSNDGWNEVAGWSHRWSVDAKRPGVLVTLQDCLETGWNDLYR